ncbi:MAG: hypothetical protein KF701_07205 [Anaerolineales bacterium]|nr:MAG: hypothetical protein KF701_07205 [Anaerolineales bacterium]
MTSASKTISFSKALLYVSLILGVIISLGAFPSVALAQDPGDTPTPTATETYTNTPEPSPTPDSSTPTETPEATTEEPTATIDATLTATTTGTATQTATSTPDKGGLQVYGMGQPLTLTGYFSIIWGDDADNNERKIFSITEEDGNHTQLLIHPNLIVSAGGETRLQGANVTVSGTWMGQQSMNASAEGGEGGGALQVNSLSLVSFGPQAASGDVSAAVTGTKPYINLLCRFSNHGNTPNPRAYYTRLLDDTYPRLSSYWRELSYNAMNISGSDSAGWFNLPKPLASYVLNGELNWWLMAEDCTNVANSSVNFAAFAGINIFFNQNLGCCAWGGASQWMTLDGVTKNWPMTWMPLWSHTQVITAHEMGHSFGLPHSIAGGWDVMGGVWCFVNDPTYGCVAPHTLAYHKQRLGWIPSSKIFVPPSNGEVTITLDRLAQPTNNSNRYLMARIPINGSSTNYYTVEARQLIGYDLGIPGQAVIIAHVNTGRNEPAHVVDADNNGDPSDAGGQWVVGETFTDSAAKIRVRIDSQNATSFTITIITGTGSPAAQPSLTGPANNMFTTNPTPVFTWNAAANAATYQFQLASDAGFTQIVRSKQGAVLTYTPPSALADGVYYWRVRGINNLGYAGPWSAVRSFTLDRVPPTAPKLTSPANGATARGVPQVQWQPSVGAVRYQIQYSTSAAFDTALQEYGGIKTTTYKPSGYNPPLGTLYWRVRAVDAAGNWSGWSNARSITILPKLVTVAPKLTTPANNASLNLASIVFNWAAVAQGDTYHIQISTNAQFKTPHTVNTTLGSGVLTLTDSGLAEGTYYWRVRGRNVNGEAGPWSATGKFIVDRTAPAAPNLTGPADGSTARGVPQVKWSKPAGAVRYQIEFSPSIAFDTAVQQYGGIKANVYKPPASYTPPLGTLYWQVRAVDAAGNWSAWSTPRSITILPKKVTVAPKLTNPANNAVLNLMDITFNWSAVANGDTYQIQVNTSSQFKPPHAVNTTLGSGVLTLTESGLGEGTYFWRVRGRNVNGEAGPWSTVRQFTVDRTAPLPPKLSSPANGSTSRGLPQVQWKPSVGAVRYQIQYSPSIAFDTAVQQYGGITVTTYKPNNYTPPAGVLYWKVRAMDAAGNWSAWSNIRSINITP